MRKSKRYLFGDKYLFSILPNQQRVRFDFRLILYAVNYGRVGKYNMRKSKRYVEAVGRRATHPRNAPNKIETMRSGTPPNGSKGFDALRRTHAVSMRYGGHVFVRMKTRGPSRPHSLVDEQQARARTHRRCISRFDRDDKGAALQGPMSCWPQACEGNIKTHSRPQPSRRSFCFFFFFCGVMRYLVVPIAWGAAMCLRYPPPPPPLQTR
jgi:hypothetical protein